jgi:hypothetical protein
MFIKIRVPLVELFVTILLLGSASFASASTLQGVKITRLHINRGLPQKVFITTSTPVSAQPHPACATDLQWNYVMPLVTDTEKAMYASLLAAYTSQSSIDLIGPDACDVYPTIESLVMFTLTK